MIEDYIGLVKTRLHYHQFTWQGLANASIHNSLIFSVVYAVAIAAVKMGHPDFQEHSLLRITQRKQDRYSRTHPVQDRAELLLSQSRHQDSA